MKRILGYLLLIVFLPVTISARSYLQEIESNFIYSNWTYNKGFPTNNALDVYQNSEEYIWITTYEGLIRFDGKEFKLFNKFSGEGFEFNSATTLFEDSQNRLWIGTNENGIAYYKNGNFYSLNSSDGFNSTSINDIKEDSQGNIWVAGANGLTVLKKSDNSETFEIKEIIKNEYSISQLAFLNSEEILLITGNGKLLTYSDGGINDFLPENDSLQNYKYQSLMIDSNDNKWFGATSGEIIKISKDKKVEIFKNEGIFSINMLLEESNRNYEKLIIFCSDNGVGVFDEENNRFDLVRKSDGLISNSIESIFLDREKNIWLTSKRAGLQKITVGKFKNYKKKDGLPDEIVNTIEQSAANEYWIGTNQGLAILKADKFEKNRFTDYFNNTRIRQIFEDSENTMWISTYSNKALVRIKNNQIKSFNTETGLASSKVRVVFEDSKGYIWIGTTGGLNVIKNPQSEVIEIEKGPGELASSYIMCIAEDNEGNIIIGTNGKGIYSLDSNFNIRNYTKSKGLSGNVIFKVFYDSLGNGWIASNEGVSLWAENRFYNYTINNGLMSNAVYQIIEDNNKKLWFTSSKGVSSVKIKELIAKKTDYSGKLNMEKYDLTDGFLESSTATSWGIKDRNGKLWFPTLKGVSVLDINNLSLNSRTNRVVINEVNIDGNNYSPNSEVIVNPSDRRIRFKFAALSYSNPSKIKYSYYLSNFDTTWSEPSYEQEAVYTNLSPGSYTLHVKASNSDGVWSSDSIKYFFTRKAAFYETVYFYLIIIILIVSFVTGVFLVRINRLNAKRKLISTMLEDTITALTSAIDAKDSYTKGHSLRVAEISQRIGEELKLDEESLKDLRYTALLHDIGKIGVDDRIIRKSEKLTDEEFSKMQEHPIIGGNILDKGSLKRFSEGARYHHEKYNGKGYGYKKQLSGDSIPIFARIISVADVYDALMSDRPYRKSLGKKVSQEIINKDSGEHFDPKIVEAFNNIIDDLDDLKFT